MGKKWKGKKEKQGKQWTCRLVFFFAFSMFFFCFFFFLPGRNQKQKSKKQIEKAK